MSSESPAAPPAGAASTDGLAWAWARAAELAAGASMSHLDAPAPDADGRIVLAAGLLQKGADGPGANSILVVPSMRVHAGQSLVMGSPGGRPLTVVTALLEIGDGGRVLVESEVALHARSVVAEGDSPFILVGADGQPGPDGKDQPKAYSTRGDRGEDGKEGHPGEPGPGGTFWFGQVSGTLNVVAGGGSGGRGGNGGRGGDSGYTEDGWHGFDGADGGDGGTGGKTGDGGTVLIAYGTMAPGGSIQCTAHMAAPGPPGLPGQPGQPGPRSGGGQCAPGNPGKAGKQGALGEATVFLVRQDV